MTSSSTYPATLDTFNVAIDGAKTLADASQKHSEVHDWIGDALNKIEAELGVNLSYVQVPTGVVNPFAGSSAPSEWLLCDASNVSRSTYANLFEVIGTAYGSGDGSTTFGLPDLRGRVPVGKSTDTAFDVLGETGGEKTHALSTAELAAHTHSELLGWGAGATSYPLLGGGYAEYGYGNTGSTGSGTAHNNLQPYITLNYIIKT